MKKYINYSIATLVAICAGCSDFGDTNVSPNGASTPLTSALLTNALTTLGASTTSGANLTAGLYCQYFAETLYTDASRYSIQDVNWTELSGNMYDLQNIININSDPKTAEYAALNGSNSHQIAIARILKAYRFSVLTDRYGDMPYFDAMKGETQPAFDSQELIYKDIFKELTEAVAQFDDGITVKGDILFDGDVSKWKKFANSWRLILALRVSNVDAALGKAQFNAALTADGGILESIDDDINFTYPGNSVAFSNPWYGIGGDDNVSTTMADFLNKNGDLRNHVYGTFSDDQNKLVGVPPGLQRQDAIAYTSKPENADHSLILADEFRLATSTLSILTYADVTLARAEAAQRTWTSEDASALYEEGLMASWDHWGLEYDQSDFDAFLQKADITLTSGNALAKICTQRWVTFYPNGPQGWSEWRRTGFPALAPAPVPVNTSGLIPIRFIYPTVEYGLNSTNVSDAVSRLAKGDTQDSNVWWDK